ncbi:DNA methylase N-4/N-6 domain protein [Candidatus Vecturithrix granuli]|uniref:Methyltransferase n=1 Tax=Vecturithrix granuli TaxID=1499967 RepID=A0A081C933_VECG1|nr:DNA methylase N-4/N-6 domain protein [Candidatus Vecturithrix granuli]
MYAKIVPTNFTEEPIKGAPDNSPDKLRNIHENVFHFVKQPNGYYYNSDAIRTRPREAKVVNGSIVSATGVSGVRYKRQIELAADLTEQEKSHAINALNTMLMKVKMGEVSDFRMIIRGRQRTTHSDAENLSGRAKELKEKGFYFLCYHPNGTKPSDVWEIIPEDTQHRKEHYAAYPADLCNIPISATCPPNGTVLDPFCGTGTTLVVAQSFHRKSIGIDISQDYLQQSIERLNTSYEGQQYVLFHEYIRERAECDYE